MRRRGGSDQDVAEGMPRGRWQSRPDRRRSVGHVGTRASSSPRGLSVISYRFSWPLVSDDGASVARGDLSPCRVACTRADADGGNLCERLCHATDPDGHQHGDRCAHVAAWTLGNDPRGNGTPADPALAGRHVGLRSSMPGSLRWPAVHSTVALGREHTGRRTHVAARRRRHGCPRCHHGSRRWGSARWQRRRPDGTER